METKFNIRKQKSIEIESKLMKKTYHQSNKKQSPRHSYIAHNDMNVSQTNSIKIGARLSIIKKKNQQVITHLTKLPSKDKHLMTAQIKCFMMSNHTHDSHLIDQKIVANALEKIKNNYRRQQTYQFSNNSFLLFSDIVIKKYGDSIILVSTFQQCMKEKYPPTVQMMFIYLGVFLFSINSQYEMAENYCQKLFDMIVRYKVEEFFIIYLLLRIKLKTNLSEWDDALTLLTKLVYFSWMYNLPDLEIWCYFQLSRVYFFLQMNKKSQIFRIKSQNNSTQPKRSIYREVSISNLIIEIESIWQGQLDFKFNSLIQQNRLQIPQVSRYGVEQYIQDQRKLKANIKSIVQDCRIRHVSNLLNRIGQISMHHIQKQNLSQNNMAPHHLKSFESLGNKLNILSSQNSCNNSEYNNAKSGNNFLLTHKSFNKNMNMFFRKRCSQERSNKRVFYTIQNSQKNWAVLKQMLKNIFLEMSYFSPPIST